MDNVLNETNCTKISELLFEMTNKRFKVIKDDHMKNLHIICQESDAYVNRVFTLLIDCLKKPHSEIRYNAFIIFNIFFRMYRCFRALAVEDLNIILNLLVDMNCDSKLPPPKAAANELKRFFLKSIKEWVEEFAGENFKLRLCYEFLLRKKQVNFEKLELEDRASRQRKEEERLKKQKFTEKKLKVLRNEIEDLKPEIINIRNALESCFKMLVPTPEEFYISDVNDSQNETCTSIIEKRDSSTFTEDINGIPSMYRETGIFTGSFSVNINIPKDGVVKIIETEENEIIIANAKDYYKLLNKKHNVIRSWIRNLTSYSVNCQELKEVIDLKVDIEKIFKKYQSLSFEKEEINSSDGDSDGMEEVVFHSPTADEMLISDLNSQDEMKPSTSRENQDKKFTVVDQKNVERKKKLLELAPKLPFDIDLYHWEEENVTTPMLHPFFTEGQNFWSTRDDNEAIPVPEGAAALRIRTIEFTGKFEPVKWSCRFPLLGGKLCPRRDRYKCPFHGIIVARDEAGKCINPEYAKKDRELQSKLSQLETQDPEILSQIKMATGVDLRLVHKSKRRKKNVGSELTNIRKEQNTVRRRLEKKVFKKSTVKKVAMLLDNLDQRRFRDKFGDQFQYVHDTI